MPLGISRGAFNYMGGGGAGGGAAPALTGWLGYYGVENIADNNIVKHYVDSNKDFYLPFSNQINSINTSTVMKITNDGTLSTTWSRIYGTDGNLYIQGFNVDSSGNFYWAGYAGDLDTMFVMKFDSSMSLTWARKLVGEGITLGYRSVVDSSGNVYLCGSTNKVSLGYGTNAVLAKYNSSGTLQWQKMLTGTTSAAESFTVMSISPDGYIYCLGISNSAGGAGSNDAYLVKYNSSGTLQWQKSIGTASAESVPGEMYIDSNNNLYIRIGTTASPASGNDSIVIKLNSNGEIQWQKMFQFSTGNETINSFSFDGTHLWLSGMITDTDTRSVFIKIDLDGTVISQKSFNVSSYNDNPMSIIVDSDYIYLFGRNNVSGSAPGGDSAQNNLLVGRISKDTTTDGTYTLGSASITIGTEYSMTTTTTSLTVTDRSLTEYSDQLTDGGSFTADVATPSFSRFSFVTLPT